MFKDFNLYDAPPPLLQRNALTDIKYRLVDIFNKNIAPIPKTVMVFYFMNQKI